MTTSAALDLIGTRNYQSHIELANTSPPLQDAGTENFNTPSDATLMARNGESWP
jgi:hypothetical protein